MGASMSSPQGFDEGDLSTKGKKDSVDPILEKLRTLHAVTPILKVQTTTDPSLTDILLRRSPSQASEALDPTSTIKLFELYQEWQRATAAKVGKNQEELGHKIIGVEELSMKLLQRLNYASRVMEASATQLQEDIACWLVESMAKYLSLLWWSVHSLQNEVLEMKRKLTATLENYEKLSQKVEALGLQKRNVKPMAIVNPLREGKDDTHANVISPSEASHGSAADA